MLDWLKKNKRTKPVALQAGTKTLCDACEGESVRIEGLAVDHVEAQRLRELGFCEKARVQKISQNGALICQVCETKVMISQGLARNIIVETCTEEEREYMSESNKKIILLSELSQGQEGLIHDFILENDTCARLEEMGVTPGEPVQVIRYAPLGDPIEIKIRGYHLSLRKEEAELIQVKI